MSSETFKIRPAGRHILTIGRELIQDPYAAIVELVKNAYDADATKVFVNFKRNEENNTIEIVIKDNGVGMTRDVVLNYWMVPSTDNKKRNKETSLGRLVQGRKGIGRYSASILGEMMTLETTSVSNDERTKVVIDWTEFEKAIYLSDVDISIETNKVHGEYGTCISIIGSLSYLNQWGNDEFTRLQTELRKIISPIKKNDKDNFQIFLSIKGFSYNNGCFEKEMDPFPLFDLFDYRIFGEINEKGIGLLKYRTQKIRNSAEEPIAVDFGDTGCGSVSFDIRVFDRDKESIDGLINRGLVDSSGQYFGKKQARLLLDKNNGIGVYRNGFRIRPLGDPQFDWLELNRKRIQNPTRKIGSDQVIGIVNVETEDRSGLIEKSARDGLRENNAYDALKKITGFVISKLEERRYNFRFMNGIGRKQAKIERDLERMMSFDSLRKNVDVVFKHEKISETAKNSILSIIDDAEKEKNEMLLSIKETVAIYQGQATVGKIVNVVLHEARKPLAFFKNQIPLFNRYYDDLVNSGCANKVLDEKASLTSDVRSDLLKKISEKVQQIPLQSEMLVKLFQKIDPLAMGKRGKKKKVYVIASIKEVLDIFHEELQSINVNINGDEKAYIECWQQDLYAVFANLIENSIYWLNSRKMTQKSINIHLSTKNNEIELIDFRDNGPGIDDEYIESQVIFEPYFSTKTDGSGLGLAIAGEAAERMGFRLMAKHFDNGANFLLQKKD